MDFQEQEKSYSDLKKKYQSFLKLVNQANQERFTNPQQYQDLLNLVAQNKDKVQGLYDQFYSARDSITNTRKQNEGNIISQIQKELSGMTPQPNQGMKPMVPDQSMKPMQQNMLNSNTPVNMMNPGQPATTQTPQVASQELPPNYGSTMPFVADKFQDDVGRMSRNLEGVDNYYQTANYYKPRGSIPVKPGINPQTGRAYQ